MKAKKKPIKYMVSENRKMPKLQRRKRMHDLALAGSVDAIMITAVTVMAMVAADMGVATVTEGDTGIANPLV